MSSHLGELLSAQAHNTKPPFWWGEQSCCIGERSLGKPLIISEPENTQFLWKLDLPHVMSGYLLLPGCVGKGSTFCLFLWPSCCISPGSTSFVCGGDREEGEEGEIILSLEAFSFDLFQIEVQPLTCLSSKRLSVSLSWVRGWTRKPPELLLNLSYFIFLNNPEQWGQQTRIQVIILCKRIVYCINFL